MTGGSITLLHGDNRDHLRRLIDQGVRVHSVCTDPPYGLTSVVKRFGKDGSAPALSNGATGVFGRQSAGFMGSKWDGTGIERDPEFWALVYEILLPGGYCLAFSSPRTGHWQACAMELAGFIMHPFLGWIYGQGFPKAHNASKAIDKALGAERERVKPERTPGWQRNIGNTRPYMFDPEHTTVSDEPVTAAVAAWDGWAYGAQALKPALEPIYVGQKPYSEKNGALNLLRHGVGAMNIDGCQVPVDPEADSSQIRTMARGERQGGDGWGMGAVARATVVSTQGRHPANLLHDGSDAVLALFPDSKGQMGSVPRTEPSHTGDENTHCYGEYGRIPAPKRGDSGSAARFFNAFPPDDAQENSDAPQEISYCNVGNESRTNSEWNPEPILYHPKAGKADRAGSKHPTVKPIGLMRWLCRLVTPAGGTVLDPFAGSGTTGEAARQEGFECILIEAEDQFATDIRRRFGLGNGPVDGSVSDASPETDDILASFVSDAFAELIE